MALRLRGIGSQLIVPIQCGVEMVGALEMSGHRERPWSRFEISRTRLIADQLGQYWTAPTPLQPKPSPQCSAAPRDAPDRHAGQRTFA
jgi:hypothetical protein